MLSLPKPQPLNPDAAPRPRPGFSFLLFGVVVFVFWLCVCVCVWFLFFLNLREREREREREIVGWLLACLTSQQQASVSQGRICSDNFTCCHTEIEVADQTFYLTHSQYTDTGPTSPSADPITPGAWQGSHWSANF